MFLELNLKKSKWLLFGGYNPNKESITEFTQGVGSLYAEIRQLYITRRFLTQKLKKKI